MYLIDANVLIDAKRDYYGIDSVPEFWSWLVDQGEKQNIKIPVEIYEEFADSKNKDGEKDDLAEWAEQEDVKSALLFDEDVDPDLVSRITYGGYTPNPTDHQVDEIGKDPFLMAYALKDTENRCVVSTEKSKPSKKEHNRRIPDVCRDFGIPFADSFTMFRALNFRTNWKK